MAIKDLLKKKSERVAKNPEERTEPNASGKDVEKEPKVKEAAQAKSVGGIAPGILLGPHITEKAGRAAERNQYIFKVAPGATKPAIARAVYEVYGVRPTAVATLNMPRKLRRKGRSEGFTTALHKAVVTLPAGKTIEILPR